MELTPSDGLLVFLNTEEFCALCLAMIRGDSISGDMLWKRYYYEGSTFEIVNDEDEFVFQLIN